MNSLFPEFLVDALGYTLLHSLWQGTAVALAAWMLLARTKDSGKRFWIAYGGMLLAAAGAAATFCWLMQQGPLPGMDMTETTLSGVPAPALAEAAEAGPASLPELRPFLPYLVAVWIAGMLVFLLRMAGGMVLLQRILRHSRPAPYGEWTAALQKLLDRYRRPLDVGLRLSAHIASPMTMGYFKPVILVPIAVINQLTPEEAEAVLAHELAHIIRKDWLLNIFQTLIEAVFYFHPAIWWLSAVARKERENGSDDLAIRLTGNRIAFAKSLLRIQEIARPPEAASLAMAMTGGKFHLLDRIQRILKPQQQNKLQLMEKLVASAIIVAALLLAGVRSGATHNSARLLTTVTAQSAEWIGWQAEPDSVPVPKKRRVEKIVRDDGEQRVEMEIENGEVRKLSIDGDEVPAADIPRYKELTDEVLRDVPPPPPAPDMPAAPREPRMPAPPSWHAAPRPPAPPSPPVHIRTEKGDDGNTIIFMERKGEPMEIIVNEDVVIIDGKEIRTGESLQIPGMGDDPFFWSDDQGRNIQMGKQRFFLFEGEPGGMDAPFEMHFQSPDLRREIRIEKEIMDREEALQMRTEAERRREQIIIRKHLEEERGLAPGPRSPNHLVTRLLADGLIKDPNNYSVELTSKHLKVNGKKQSTEAHQKYLRIYRSLFGKEMPAKGVYRLEERH